ncbi:uncharacterized protein CDAR_380111, partial [Caerostris darwini]
GFLSIKPISRPRGETLLYYMFGFSNRRACIKATLLRPGRILIALEPAETTKSLRCGQLESGKKNPFPMQVLSDPQTGEAPGETRGRNVRSPTKTLLRLLLPLNDQVWSSFRHFGSTTKANPSASPKTSLNHSIGSSDGRCGQRAGT